MAAQSAAKPAPNGYLASGEISPNAEATRDGMLNKFDERIALLKDNTLYYTSQRRPSAIGIATPPEMQSLLTHVGYPRLYINALSERLELEGFRIAGNKDADTKLWDWWQANDLDIESTLGHTDAFVHGRSYVTISAPDPAIDLNVDPAVPIIRVEPPTNLFAAIDPKTRQVRQAIRATYDDEGTKIISSTLYLPDATFLYEQQEGGWKLIGQVDHALGIVPVVPLANRTQLSDLYGTSEITPELRSVTDAAARILMDMQATAELMAVPLRLLFGVKPQELGLSDNANATDRRAAFEAYYARILAFQDVDGKAQQFSAAELMNFVNALDALDKKAAAYTGLPPQYLSFGSQNPASAEAIKSSESRLVLNAQRKGKIFGGAWEQVMRIATKVMGSDIPTPMYRMEAIFRDPSTPTFAAKADGTVKLFAAGVIPRERARIDMGYSVEERLEMDQWDKDENQVSAAIKAITNPVAAPGANPANPAATPGNGPAATPASTSTATKPTKTPGA